MSKSIGLLVRLRRGSPEEIQRLLARLFGAFERPSRQALGGFGGAVERDPRHGGALTLREALCEGQEVECWSRGFEIDIYISHILIKYKLYNSIISHILEFDQSSIEEYPSSWLTCFYISPVFLLASRDFGDVRWVWSSY